MGGMNDLLPKKFSKKIKGKHKQWPKKTIQFVVNTQMLAN